MIQRIIKLAVVLFILVNCENEPEVKEFPVLKTLNPKNIDETGATFRGELVLKGKNKTTSYGFIWSMEEPRINTSKKIVLGGELSEGVFETRIDSLLAKGFEYKIRTFATYEDKTIYGNTVTFACEGSTKSLWSKELSGISLGGWGKPYGWSDDKNGYVIFQYAKVFKFDPEKVQFLRIADFPESGNTGTKYTSIAKDKIQYIFNSTDKNLYQLKDRAWSIKSKTPLYFYTSPYYHCYSTLNEIFILSSAESYSYDPEKSLWQTKSKVPAKNYSIGGAYLNGFVYIMDNEKIIRKYNPQEDSWQYISTFPVNFSEGLMFYEYYIGEIIGFSHDNNLYYGFCYDDEKEIDETIWKFNIATNTWKEIQTFPIDLAPGNIFYFYLNEKLYIGHGIKGIYTIYSLDLSKI
jgi:hypothetical protein